MMAIPQEATYGAFRAVAITPSNTEIIEPIPRGIYVGGAGDVAVVMADGSEVTFTAAAGGVEHAWQVKQILSTGTDATDLVALY